MDGLLCNMFDIWVVNLQWPHRLIEIRHNLLPHGFAEVGQWNRVKHRSLTHSLRETVHSGYRGLQEGNWGRRRASLGVLRLAGDEHRPRRRIFHRAKQERAGTKFGSSASTIPILVTRHLKGRQDNRLLPVNVLIGDTQWARWSNWAHWRISSLHGKMEVELGNPKWSAWTYNSLRSPKMNALMLRCLATQLHNVHWFSFNCSHVHYWSCHNVQCSTISQCSVMFMSLHVCQTIFIKHIWYSTKQWYLGHLRAALQHTNRLSWLTA